MKKSLLVLLLCLSLLFAGCSQEEAPVIPESTAAAAFDSAETEALLQGQWMYCDSALGSYEVLEFRQGTVTYTSWLEAAPDKVSVSEATYTVRDDGVELYFPKTDFRNFFSYAWVGNELVLFKQIESGADKGNTRVYQKQDTAVPGSAEEAVPPASSAQTNVLLGEWIAGGLVSKGSVYDFSSNASLADLYDSNWVFINEDGSFQLQNGIYTYEGVWTEAEVEGAEHFYVFSQTESFRFTMKDGELQEVSSKSEKTYFGAFLDKDCNVLLIYETLDDTESPLIYLRDGNKSHLSAMMGAGSTPAQAQSTPSKPSAGSSPAAGSKPSQAVTSGQRNALEAARNYLSFMPFSYSGLIEQLKFEGYTTAEATYAADNCGADWYEQAARAAENYLDFMSFSRTGLIEQLEFEGYTHDQAVYGVDKAY